MEGILDLIKVIDTDHPNCQLMYLKNEHGKDEDGFGTLSIKTVVKNIGLETYRFETKISKEQLQDMEALHNIGIGIGVPEDMFRSVLDKESSSNASKMIVDKMSELGDRNYKTLWTEWESRFNRWFSYVPKVSITNSSDLVRVIMRYSNIIASKSRLGQADFIIVSPGLYEMASNIEGFVFQENKEKSGIVYKAGNLYDRLEVFINQNLRFSEKTIIIGKKTEGSTEGIYMAKMKPEFKHFDIVDNSLTPYRRILLENRLGIFDTENAHNQFLRLEFTNDRHNVFTHLWKTIKDNLKRLSSRFLPL
jgi:hypothetical protein